MPSLSTAALAPLLLVAAIRAQSPPDLQPTRAPGTPIGEEATPRRVTSPREVPDALEPALPPMNGRTWPRARAESKAGIQAELGLAVGEFRHHTRGSTLSDETGAALLHVGFEAFTAKGFGGGARLELLGSDDDLFANQGFTSGEGKVGDLFGFFSYLVSNGDRFRMPLRAGIFVNSLEISESPPSAEVRWTTVGPRVGVEPEFTLVAGERASWTIFADAYVGFGPTRIEVEPDVAPGVSEFDSDGAMSGISIGTRVYARAFMAELAFVHRSYVVDQSDLESTFFVREIEDRFSAVQIAVGCRF